MLIDSIIEAGAIISIDMMACLLNVLHIYSTLYTSLCKVTLLKMGHPGVGTIQHFQAT